MRKNKFLAALAIAACLATSVPFSVNAATPGQAKDASKVTYGTVSTANQAIIQKLFDATYYAKENPDLAKAGITTEAALFNHFVKFGIFEGRACCEGFNVAAYKSSYSDLQAAFGDDIVAYYVHYVTFGQTEKRALVTVEAATAAGVTVKSAADGTVVAAGAAKPAAGGAAASSGSAASNDATTGNSGSTSNGVTKTYTNNVEVSQVTKVSEKKAEARFASAYDYDYVNTVYDLTTAAVVYNNGVNRPAGFVEVGSTVRYLTDADAVLAANASRIMSVPGGKYIDLQAGDKLENHKNRQYNEDQYLYSDEYKGYLLIAGVRGYYNGTDISGNRKWNYKSGVTVWNDKNKDSAVFRSTTKNDNAVTEHMSDYGRFDTTTQKYFTTYHLSKYNATSLTEKDGRKSYGRDPLSLNAARLTCLNGDTTLYFSSVEPISSDYVLGEYKDEYENGIVTAYAKISDIKNACDLLPGYKEYAGKIVYWGNGQTPVLQQVETPTIDKGWYKYDSNKDGVDEAFEMIDKAEALKILGYTLWNKGDEEWFKAPGTATAYTWKTTGKNMCYKNADDYKNQAKAYDDVVPVAPEKKGKTFIENGYDRTFYEVVTSSDVFVDDVDSIRQLSKNGRFYVVD
jgi:hypothetical protein